MELLELLERAPKSGRKRALILSFKQTKFFQSTNFDWVE